MHDLGTKLRNLRVNRGLTLSAMSKLLEDKHDLIIGRTMMSKCNQRPLKSKR